MTGEAAATGRPVYVFTPSAGSDKFRRFHAALRPTAPRGRCRSARGIARLDLRAAAFRRHYRAADRTPLARQKMQGADAKDAASTDEELVRRRHAVRAAAESGARAWRIAEMALLYGAAPFAVDRAVHSEGIPVFIALLPVLAIILMFLVLDRTFSLTRELSRGFPLRQLFYILLTFAVGGGIVATYVPITTRTCSSSSRATVRTSTCASCCSIR